jgi:hypothetical protein
MVENGSYNFSSFFQDFFIPEFENHYQFNFTEVNSSDNTTFPSFYSDITPISTPFYFIEENSQFNPNNVQGLMSKLQKLLRLQLFIEIIKIIFNNFLLEDLGIYNFSNDFDLEDIKNIVNQHDKNKGYSVINALINGFFLRWKDIKSLLLSYLQPQLKGIIRYEFRDFTYDMNYVPYRSFPIIWINGTWWGDDYVQDTDFIGRTCGEVDGYYSTSMDANVIFAIKQNDYDDDGITYWQESKKGPYKQSIQSGDTNNRYAVIVSGGASCKVTQTSNCGSLSSPYMGTGKLYDEGSSWTDYRVLVDLMTNDDDNDGYDEDIGVIFRYQDDQNFYILRWEQKGFRSKIFVDKVVSDVRTNLGNAYAPLLKNFWYTVNITVDGNDIEVSYNNNLISTSWNPIFCGTNKITDSTFSDGSIALFSWKNSGAWFDDIFVDKDNGDILLQEDFDLGEFFDWSNIGVSGDWAITKRLTDQEDFYIGPDFVFRLLHLIAHYDKDSICYQNVDKWRDADGDGENDVTLLSTRKNVRESLNIWLEEKSDGDDLNLVYIFNHGINAGMLEPDPAKRVEKHSYFVVDNDRNGKMDFDDISSFDLIYDISVNSWLPKYGVLGIGRLTFIIEACFIGSFLKHIAKYRLQNRIVMTSTTWDTSAGGITGQDWPAFSNTLFKSMANGRNNFKHGFNEADEFVEVENFLSVWCCTWSWKGGPEVLVPTDSRLDDNGNKVGSSYPLPGLPGDGYWAERTGL